MNIAARIGAVSALLVSLVCVGPALAEKSDYSAMTTPQLKEAISVERQAYKSVRKQIRRLTNGTMDKASPEYKARFKKLTHEAETRKVTLDTMKEVMLERKKAEAGN